MLLRGCAQGVALLASYEMGLPEPFQRMGDWLEACE